jgi:putative acetyltransferase
MARALPKLALRPYLPADALMLAEIFRSSIEQLTGEDYSEAQQQAWASAADDEQAFGARLAGELTLIATLDGSPVGFASLKGPDQIEMLYVHPAMARQGVGSMLVDALEKIATARGTNRLIVDASDTANGFFDKRGYVAQQRNTVTCGDEWLANTTMEKRLTEKPSAS